jgi:hypothetical protein
MFLHLRLKRFEKQLILCTFALFTYSSFKYISLPIKEMLNEYINTIEEELISISEKQMTVLKNIQIIYN